MKENIIFQLINTEDKELFSLIRTNDLNRLSMINNNKDNISNNEFIIENYEQQNTNLYNETLVEQNTSEFLFNKLLLALNKNNQIFDKHKNILHFHEKVSWLFFCISSLIVDKAISQAKIRSKKSENTRNFLMQYLDCKKSKLNQYITIGKALKKYPALIFCNFEKKMITIHSLTSICSEINKFSKKINNNDHSNENNNNLPNENLNLIKFNYNKLKIKNLISTYQTFQTNFNEYCSNQILKLQVNSHIKICLDLIFNESIANSKLISFFK